MGAGTVEVGRGGVHRGVEGAGAYWGVQSKGDDTGCSRRQREASRAGHAGTQRRATTRAEVRDDEDSGDDDEDEEEYVICVVGS
eukprot:COSAG01_NODE_31571_length_595_cov_1.141129_1_plen_84_part_00